MTTSSPLCPAASTHHLAPVARWAVPVVGGLLLSLGFPNELLPGAAGDHPSCWIAWLALLPLMWMLYSWPARAARTGAWLYSATFFLGLLSWMRLFGLLPWALLAGIMSLTIWLAILLSHSMSLPRWLSPFGLACAWTGIEWARSQSIFGFAWGEIGGSQIDGFPARLASLGSIYLITFFMLLLSGIVMQSICDHHAPPRWFITVTVAVTVLCLGAGWWQTTRTQSRWQHASHAQVFALVQPCSQRGLTPQVLVTPLTYEDMTSRVNTLLSLSQQSLKNIQRVNGVPPPIVIWSETALPISTAYLPQVFNLAIKEHCYLLAGAPYYPPASNNPFNSADLIAPNGAMLDRYKKIHLVPFGEFVPMRALVQHFYTVRDDDILPGPGWRPLQIGAQRIGVGICFESTFPAIARAYAKQGAQYLIYITNDAWFHQTSGVRQHYNCSRFRALETGLPVVRVAGTGISGFIAPNGHSISEIPVYVQGTATRSIPAGSPGTFYTLIGWAFPPLCLLISLLLSLRGLWRRNRSGG